MIKDNNIEKVREFAFKHARTGEESIHGIDHWDRVARNGEALHVSGADMEVVLCVAYLHDVERESDAYYEVRFEGMQRYETLEIPKEALREILYNAIAHKDYSGPDIQMHVYNDLIEIWNEGTLPEGYDENVLYSKHSSKPRNRNIADTMFKAGFIDTRGRGYKKIHDGFEAAGMPMPKVQNFCGGVQITIERTKFMQMLGATDNGGSFGGSGGSLAVVQLSERQKRICDTINPIPK